MMILVKSGKVSEFSTPKAAPSDAGNCPGCRPDEQLQPHMVVHKVRDRTADPFDGVLVFLEPLLRRATFFIK
jgi:hypothetical protein